MAGPAFLRRLSVARQILLLQVLVVAVLVAVALGLAAYDARADARSSALERAVAVASTLADSPTLRAALRTPEPQTVIAPEAEQVRADSGVDFVTVMNMDRIRYSHPDPAQIGRRFIGGVGGAPQGRVFTQEYAGRLGPSMRAVVPVREGDRVVAMIAVGLTIHRIDRQLRSDLLPVGLAAIAVLAVGLLGAGLISRRLGRQTHGLGEQEITRMYEYYAAVLHAVREGLLLLDTDGRVRLANDEARRLLDLPDDVEGRDVRGLGLAPGLVRTALARVEESDDIYVAGDRVLVVSSAPARWEGRDVGAVVSLRDHTELRQVTGQLDVVRSLTESLRSQNHEAANRLHTVISLVEMGRPEEAVDFATEELHLAQALADRLMGAVGDPVVAALLLGKTSDAVERGIELAVHGEVPAELGLAPKDLVTVLGNLVDNAFDAVAALPTGWAASSERRVEVRLEPVERPEPGAGGLRIVVGDSGTGLSEEDAAHALERGWTTKAGASAGRGLGLALVGQVARRLGGSVRIGRSALGGAELTVEVPAPAASLTEVPVR